MASHESANQTYLEEGVTLLELALTTALDFAEQRKIWAELPKDREPVSPTSPRLLIIDRALIVVEYALATKVTTVRLRVRPRVSQEAVVRKIFAETWANLDGAVGSLTRQTKIGGTAGWISVTFEVDETLRKSAYSPHCKNTGRPA